MQRGGVVGRPCRGQAPASGERAMARSGDSLAAATTSPIALRFSPTGGCMLRSLALLSLVAVSASFTPHTDRVRANDNRRPAGTLRNGVLSVQLEARVASWHPDGDKAPGADIFSFAEAGEAAQIPGPLLRVVAGTRVTGTLRNALPSD